MNKAHARKQAERNAVLDEVQKAVAGGETVRAAVERLGIPYPTYYSWHKKYRGRSAGPRGVIRKRTSGDSVTLGVKDGQVLVVLGGAKDVPSVVRALAIEET